MPNWLAELAGVASNAINAYDQSRRQQMQDALEAAKEKRDAAAADLMRRVQEQNLATSITNQDLAAAAAGFRAPKALKAAIAKNLTPDLTRTAGFGGVPSLPVDAPSASEQMQDDLPTITVRGQQLVQDLTQTPTAIAQRNELIRFNRENDAAIAAAELIAKEKREEAARDRAARSGPRVPRLPASTIDKLAGMDTIIQMGEDVEAGLKSAAATGTNVTGRFLGMIPTAPWMKNLVGMGGDAGTDLRALIGNLYGTIAKERSGTALSAAEIGILEQYVPGHNDSEGDAAVKALRFVRQMKKFKKARIEAFNTYGGQSFDNETDPREESPYGGVELIPPPEN